MGSKVEYVDSSHIYVSNYVRNSKAVGVLWGIFTICYAIIIIVAFVTPEWIGDTNQSENAGRFGLWMQCSYKTNLEINGIGVEECKGSLTNITTLPNIAFQAAAVLVAISVLISLVTICALLLFFFFTSTKVFHITGWLQLLSGIFMFLALVVFPIGWDADEVKQVCGNSDIYDIGECGVRWSYHLAIIGALDAIILASLAFVLATRHIKLQPDHGHLQNGNLFKGEMNSAYLGDGQSLAGSRKSLNVHPVLMMPQPAEMDRFSEYSHRTGRTKSSAYRPSYPSSMQNFQL